jgi:hypothetical protein
VIHRPVRVATKLGIFAQTLYTLLPRVSQVLMNTAYRMFPDSKAARGEKAKGEAPQEVTPDQMAFAQFMRGIHL